jgi:hypothetical protein
MVETVITVKEVSVDWITASAKDPAICTSLRCLAERITDSQVADGNTRGPWKQYGYAGECTEGISWGGKLGGFLVRLSGFAAAFWWREVLAHAENVSRLDVQVTVQTDPMREHVARDAYRQLCGAGAAGRKGASCSFVVSSGGGSTCYLGRRSSDKYFRLYDKQRESGEPWYAGCWRYELECKNQVAMDLARHLSAGDDWQRRARDTVHGYCTGHGLDPLYGPGTEGLQFETPRPATELDRQCDWIQSQVSATAQTIVDRLGFDKLVQLLGLDSQAIKWRGRGPHRPHGNHNDHDDGQLD